jgi:hypothetical protein
VGHDTVSESINLFTFSYKDSGEALQLSEQEAWKKWKPVIEHLLWQSYYRVLSFVSFPAPVGEAYLAAQSLSEQLGGKVYWRLEGRVFQWNDAEFSPGLKINVLFFGSAVRGKNTVMTRRNWRGMYLYEPIITLMVAHLRVNG